MFKIIENKTHKVVSWLRNEQELEDFCNVSDGIRDKTWYSVYTVKCVLDEFIDPEEDNDDVKWLKSLDQNTKLWQADYLRCPGNSFREVFSVTPISIVDAAKAYLEHDNQFTLVVVDEDELG